MDNQTRKDNQDQDQPESVMDNQTRKDNQDQDQPESVLNIIRKEFFDLGGHDKDDDLKRSL